MIRSITKVLGAAAVGALLLASVAPEDARSATGGTGSGKSSSGDRKPNEKNTDKGSEKAKSPSTTSKSDKSSSRTSGQKRYPKADTKPDTKNQRVYVPPKAPPPKDPPKKPPYDQTGKPPGKPPIIVNPYPPRYDPKYPRRPPILVFPFPTYVAPPPVVTTFVPPPPEPPRYREPPRRPTPAAVPPINDLRQARDREIIIAVADTVTDADVIALGQGQTLNVEVQYRSSLLGVKIVRLRIPDNRALPVALDRLVQAAATDPRILAVQPNFVFESSQTVPAVKANFTALPQYAPEKVRLTEAHRTSMGRNVRVAVIDTGMDANHPELAGAVADSFDAIGEGPATFEAHGTAIAGIVASQQQIKGIAPDARVLAVRAFAGSGSVKPAATTLSIIKGLDWAAANAARVVNMSFAGPRDPLLQAAIAAAEAKGMILVAAAGNGGPKAASAYPAAFENVIAVTASDSDDELYEKANRGDYVAIAAPGVDILTPAPKGAYEMSSGTSLAAAHVSGIIALMLERKPGLTTQDVRTVLSQTARDPDKKSAKRGLGAGIVDAAKAVAAVN